LITCVGGRGVGEGVGGGGGHQDNILYFRNDKLFGVGVEEETVRVELEETLRSKAAEREERVREAAREKYLLNLHGCVCVCVCVCVVCVWCVCERERGSGRQQERNTF
jgi:hypothetical protein